MPDAGAGTPGGAAKMAALSGRRAVPDENRPMLILNFAHPLAQEQLRQIALLEGQPIDRVIALETQFDLGQAFEPQLLRLMERIDLSLEAWQTEKIVVNLPTLSSIAAVLLAELHGRMGYFPSIVRLLPIDGEPPSRAHVAEMLKLQTLRDKAREQRAAIGEDHGRA